MLAKMLRFIKTNKICLLVSKCIIIMSCIVTLLHISSRAITYVENRATAIRCHSLTVAKLKLQATYIIRYVQDTAKSPQAIEDVLIHYDGTDLDCRHLFGNESEASDAWGNTIKWSVNNGLHTMTGLSLGEDKKLGGKGLARDIILLIDVSTNVINMSNIYDAILSGSENIQIYGVIDEFFKKY